MDTVSTLILRLDPKSKAAPYRQIVEQVQSAIQRGLLKPGDRVPSVREIVAQLAVNPNTVQRALRELDSQGLTRGIWGLGTFVASAAPALVAGGDSQVSAALRLFVEAAIEAGLTAADAQRMLNAAMPESSAAR